MSVGGECLAPCLLQVYIPEAVDSPRNVEPCQRAAAREPETSSRAQLLLYGVCLFFWFLVFFPIFTSLTF